MKSSRPDPDERALLAKSKGETVEPERPFAETVSRHLPFQYDSVMSSAPETSGVYGLYNALWVYIGEADNISGS